MSTINNPWIKVGLLSLFLFVVFVTLAGGFLLHHMLVYYEMYTGDSILVDIYLNVALGVLGLTALNLSFSDDIKIKKYGCIVGITSQPLWLYITWEAQTYGPFVLSIAYAFTWLRQWYRLWVVPWRNNRGN